MALNLFLLIVKNSSNGCPVKMFNCSNINYVNESQQLERLKLQMGLCPAIAGNKCSGNTVNYLERDFQMVSPDG